MYIEDFSHSRDSPHTPHPKLDKLKKMDGWMDESLDGGLDGGLDGWMKMSFPLNVV